MSDTGGTLAEVVCRDVLFAHWPIDPARLRPVVPDTLSIDTFDDSAWVSAVVVNIPEARVRGVPYRPSVPSINLRTYVSHPDEDPGVYFLSMEMDGRLSALFGRLGFGMPYHNTAIDVGYRDGACYVTSRRDRQSGPPARFDATYRPDTDAGPAGVEPETLDEFLIDRTNYFFPARPGLRRTIEMLGTSDTSGTQTGTRTRSPSAASASASVSASTSGTPTEPDESVFVGALAHEPWSLLPVEAEITANTLFEGADIPEPDVSSPPTFHYARQQHMAAERLRELPVARHD